MTVPLLQGATGVGGVDSSNIHLQMMAQNNGGVPGYPGGMVIPPGVSGMQAASYNGNGAMGSSGTMAGNSVAGVPNTVKMSKIIACEIKVKCKR